MSSQTDLRTSASETWAAIRPPVFARIVDAWLGPLLNGLAVFACLALIGYIEYLLCKRAWKLDYAWEGESDAK